MGKMSKRGISSVKIFPALFLLPIFLRPGRGFHGQGEKPLVPPRNFYCLEKVLKKMWKAGLSNEASELRSIMLSLGYPVKRMEKLDKTFKRIPRTAKKNASTPKLRDIARELRTAASKLAYHLKKNKGERARRLAELVLKIDGDNDEANKYLGNTRIGNKWVAGEERRILKRRAEIDEAIMKARKVKVPIEAGPSKDALALRLLGKNAREVKAYTISIHSTIPDSIIGRALKSVFQALALSNFIRKGVLQPSMPRPLKIFCAKGKKNYLSLVKEAVENKGIPPEEAELVKGLGAFYDKRGHITYNFIMELDLEAGTLFYSLPGLYEWQPCLFQGHYAWLCLSFLGCRPCLVVGSEKEPGNRVKRRGRTISISPEIAREWKEKRLLGNACISGCREYVKWLARRGLDPYWSETMLDMVEKIKGDLAAKATIVTEYLQEMGILGKLIDETNLQLYKGIEAPVLFSRKIGMPLRIFEHRWKTWLFDYKVGLADRIDPGNKWVPGPMEQAALKYLEKIRDRVLRKGQGYQVFPLILVEELCKGARAHANYLNLNPKQLKSWPEAHEEFPDRPGFSVLGTRAGLNSVIAFPIHNPKEAINRWLGTFYHRLPLFHPGLMGIGWGLVRRVAVLDTGSMVLDAPYNHRICWPYDGMENVPVSFCPELPSPIPGKDQSKWGYPITLQIFGNNEKPVLEVRMTLCEGSRPNDKIIPCYFISPNKPYNLDLVPHGAFCLIPKSHLEPDTMYCVKAELTSEKEEIVWTFKTR